MTSLEIADGNIEAFIPKESLKRSEFVFPLIQPIESSSPEAVARLLQQDSFSLTDSESRHHFFTEFNAIEKTDLELMAGEKENPFAEVAEKMLATVHKKDKNIKYTFNYLSQQTSDLSQEEQNLLIEGVLASLSIQAPENEFFTDELARLFESTELSIAHEIGDDQNKSNIHKIRPFSTLFDSVAGRIPHPSRLVLPIISIGFLTPGLCGTILAIMTGEQTPLHAIESASPLITITPQNGVASPTEYVSPNPEKTRTTATKTAKTTTTKPPTLETQAPLPTKTALPTPSLLPTEIKIPEPTPTLAGSWCNDDKKKWPLLFFARDALFKSFIDRTDTTTGKTYFLTRIMFFGDDTRTKAIEPKACTSGVFEKEKIIAAAKGWGATMDEIKKILETSTIPLSSEWTNPYYWFYSPGRENMELVLDWDPTTRTATWKYQAMDNTTRDAYVKKNGQPPPVK